MKLLSIFGTRPEAVKMAPVLLALREEAELQSLVCITGQHRALLDQVLDFFAIEPDFDLALMEAGQAPGPLAARILSRLDPILAEAAPDRVIVHGDTATALAAALAAFHRNIPIAHVEAGLRTYRLDQPWPEEMNRRVVDLVSDLHFAPTAAAKANLLAERLHGEVFVTGNSGIDALRHVVGRIEADPALRDSLDSILPRAAAGRRLILVTGHRRESFGATLDAICAALAALAERGDVEIVYPVHPNPEVREPVEARLRGRANVHLVPPLDLAPFVRLMQRADLILTDSGGVQEEAVALGKPVLVMRDATERPEGIGAGAARLAGTRAFRLFRQISGLLDDPARLSRFARRPDLYGDGGASRRIVDALAGRPVAEFGVARPPARDRVRRFG